MNNSFERLVEGMCTTLRAEVLPRISDEYARSQVYGVINALNTFKLRAGWSAAFLIQQVQAQRSALAEAQALAAGATGAPPVPELTPELLAGRYAGPSADPCTDPIATLLAARDAGNQALGEWLAWLATPGHGLAKEVAHGLEQTLLAALRAELSIELKFSPRPLFAEMSGGGES